MEMSVYVAVIYLTVIIGIGAYFTYKCMNCSKENVSRYDYVYQATNYLIQNARSKTNKY